MFTTPITSVRWPSSNARLRSFQFVNVRADGVIFVSSLLSGSVTHPSQDVRSPDWNFNFKWYAEAGSPPAKLRP